MHDARTHVNPCSRMRTRQDQVWDENAFYAWRYDRPTSILYYIGMGLVPVVSE